jgi:hypothetical protein
VRPDLQHTDEPNLAACSDHRAKSVERQRIRVRRRDKRPVTFVLDIAFIGGAMLREAGMTGQPPGTESPG